MKFQQTNLLKIKIMKKNIIFMLLIVIMLNSCMEKIDIPIEHQLQNELMWYNPNG